MRSTKPSLVEAIMKMIKRIAELAFNARTDAQLKKIFSLNEAEIKATIEHLLDAVPEQFILHLSVAQKNEFVNICAREFVFFQVQEKINSARYHTVLQQFIALFSRDIQSRLNQKNKHAMNIKEG